MSLFDITVLIIGGGGAAALWSIEWWWGFIPAFVVAHFFLFCNILRASRPLELCWSAVFLLLTSSTILFSTPSWFITIVATLAATVVVAIIELRKPSYHGIGWRTINPNLPAWWNANHENKPSQ